MVMGVGRVFPGGPIVEFSKYSQKDFFRVEPKTVKFHFSLQKLRKKLFLLKMSYENFKIQGALSPSCPPSDAHGNGGILFMHFCGSNHEVTRMQQEEKTATSKSIN